MVTLSLRSGVRSEAAVPLILLSMGRVDEGWAKERLTDDERLEPERDRKGGCEGCGGCWNNSVITS